MLAEQWQEFAERLAGMKVKGPARSRAEEKRKSQRT
jgi:hypothetical protein